VWTNLLDNAIDAAPDGGAVGVRTSRDHGMAVVEIRDNGGGIPDDVLARIWDPFFTTKPTGQGTGLGLDIVRRIVTRTHCGDVSVASVPGDTCFTVRLPIDGPPRE
jgi:signal transduction histidine kinase